MEPPSQTQHLLVLHLPLFLLLLSFFNESTAAGSGSGKGFGFQLIHRDSVHSPLYPGNLTSYELLERRLNYARAHAQLMEYRESRANKTIRPDILTPIVEHVKGRFEYLVRVYIGSNQIFQYLLLDTASDLIWVQCEPYGNRHFQQDPPHYVLGRSTTMDYVICDDRSMCLESYTCGSQRRCIAQESYGDGSWAKGHLARDDFYLQNDAGKTEKVPLIVFGCMNTVSEFIFGDTKIAGMLGMGLGHQSLASQLAYDRKVGSQFTYCFVPWHDQGMTYLKFDESFSFAGPSHILNVIWNPRHTSYYYVNLTGISIDNTRLNIAKKDLAIDAQGNRGCSIDSGTSVMHLFLPAYKVLETFVVRYFKSSKVERAAGPLDICFWEMGGYVKPLPSMTLHFGGGKSLVVHPDIAWEKLVQEGRNMFCLGVLMNRQVTILGANVQSNYRFVYDLKRSLIYYGQENCAAEFS